MTDAYERVSYQGHTLNKRTLAMLKEVEQRLGYGITVVQGSYHTGVSQSAGTHDGGGAVDITPADWEHKVRAMRNVGFAAWHRPYIANLWGEHIHAIAIGDKQMSSAAHSQIIDYYNHRDGLASHSYDGFYHPNPIPIFDYHKESVDEWSKGDVYVGKLHKGSHNSDSVRRLQYRLSHVWDMPHVTVDGDYGPQTVDAVARYQRKHAEHPPNNGLEVTLVQAKKLFGSEKYNVQN